MLRAHNVISPAISLARNNGDLRHGCLGESEEQLRAVLDNAVVFLICARKEARYINERDDWDIETIAEADEACALLRRVDVQATR